MTFHYGTRFLVQLPMYDPNDSNTNAGGGTNNGGGQGAGDQNANAGGNDGNRADTSRAAAGANGNNGGQGQNGQGGAKKFEYTEDRSDWLPRHRLNEESTKRTAAERERDELKTNLELVNKRLQIAMGLNPADPKAAEQEEVETALLGILGKKIPILDRLMKLKPEQLDDLLEGATAGRGARDAMYDRDRDAALESCYTEAAKQLRVDKLTERQQARIRTAFASEYLATMQERQRLAQDGRQPDPNDFVGRYLRKDPTLITDFIKDFLGDFFEPAKKLVNTSVVRRQGRPVPDGGRAETVITKLPQGDLTNDVDFKKAIIAAKNAGA